MDPITPYIFYVLVKLLLIHFERYTARWRLVYFVNPSPAPLTCPVSTEGRRYQTNTLRCGSPEITDIIQSLLNIIRTQFVFVKKYRIVSRSYCSLRSSVRLQIKIEIVYGSYTRINNRPCLRVRRPVRISFASREETCAVSFLTNSNGKLRIVRLEGTEGSLDLDQFFL